MGCCDSKLESGGPTIAGEIQRYGRRDNSRLEAGDTTAWPISKRPAASQQPQCQHAGVASYEDRMGGFKRRPSKRVRLPSAANSVTQMSPEISRLQFREVRPEDYELLCLLDEGVVKRNTAPFSSVRALPLVASEELETSDCQVCLSRLPAGPGAKVPRLPCGHAAFHLECISKWLTSCSARCPVCQASILEAPDIGHGEPLVVQNENSHPCAREEHAA
ncbi:unnamed protein product [Polarella glacialis]|uniref:RING-type domain-containing protein n=1 Tax=Polarella glacialis TaxID=89957 RepID=A0A813EMF4_POLGL|nr:unnamed protein product [Polarella glacialis]